MKHTLRIFLLCCIAFDLQAQPSGQEFFDKDFAKSPLESTKESDRSSSGIVQPSPAPVSASTAPTPGFVELGPTLTPVATLNPSDAFGTRVYAIGAVINAHNPAHFESNVKQLIQVCHDRNLAIARIYAVGSPTQYGSAIKPFLTNDWRMLSTLEFINRIVISVKPPSEYATSRSPTWLLATDKGVVVAEGYTNLMALVTNDSMLKDLSAESQVTPPPDPTPSPIAQQ